MKMREFVNNSTKFWHSHNWTFFVRITCDEYVHLKNDSSIFSFDWVSYICETIDCSKIHTERVHAIAKNNRIVTIRKKVIILQIQKAFAIDDFDSIQFKSFDFSVDKSELIFIDHFHFVVETAVVEFLTKSCNLDYNFEKNEVNISIHDLCNNRCQSCWFIFY